MCLCQPGIALQATMNYSTANHELLPCQKEERGTSLKEQLAQLTPLLQDLTRKKEERLKMFHDIRAQIQSIKSEISLSDMPQETLRIKHDSTLRKLDELQAQLQTLQKEKNDRLHKVTGSVNTVYDLCVVLGCDFVETIRGVHPSLDESLNISMKSISNETIQTLGSTITSLWEEKRRRMQQIQDLGASLIELWGSMDTPVQAQHQFQHVRCNLAAAEHEVVAADALSLRVIDQVAAEVERLDQLKCSKAKELVLKKRAELEEICRRAHMIPDDYTQLDRAIASMETGLVEPAELLVNIEERIGCTKEEAFSRKNIMDKILKWMQRVKKRANELGMRIGTVPPEEHT